MPVFHHGLNDDNTLSRFSLLIMAIFITSFIILSQICIFFKKYYKYTLNIYLELSILSKDKLSNYKKTTCRNIAAGCS